MSFTTKEVCPAAIFRNLVSVVVALMLVASMAAIWLLTEQDAVGTSQLSSSVQTAISSASTGSTGQVMQSSDIDDLSGDSDGYSSDGSTLADSNVFNDVGAFVKDLKDKALSDFNSLVLFFGVRRVAHTVEFFVMGLFAAGAALLWLQKKLSKPIIYAISLALCLAWSLVDQVHKIFVPGRHFDFLDLPFDAVGYCLAILIVVILWGIFTKEKTPKSVALATCNRST